MLIDQPPKDLSSAGIRVESPTVEQMVTTLETKGVFRHWDSNCRHYFTLRTGTDHSGKTYRESDTQFVEGIRKLYDATLHVEEKH